MMRSLRFVLVLGVMAVLAASAWADPFTDSVRARCEAILASAAGENGVYLAQAEAERLANLAAGWASPGQLAAVGWAEGTLGLLNTAADARVGELGVLASQPAFCVEIGLLVVHRDNSAGVIRLAQRLATERADAVRRYPRLGAALCVVHDEPLTRRINENTVKAPDPLEVFDFFVRHAGAMALDPAKTPSLLLVHVVNVTESIDQMEWALRSYGRQPAPGQRFFEIAYDHDSFRKGTTKKVTAAGDYRLESIKRFGGVCADQAYFAESVGKAAGIPTCYVRASGADVAHAWIGFLGLVPRPAWDFSEGRYEAYENLRGEISDPQTGAMISDGDVGLLGGLMGARADDVLASMGVARAVRRMATTRFAPESVDGVEMRGTLRVARTGVIGDRLGLLRAALTRCAAVPQAWRRVAGMRDELSGRELDEWARAVDRLCGREHQDFAFDMLSAMIGGEADAEAAHGMWDWAFGRFRARPDLASGVRFQQARMWERRERPDLAWAAYEDVLKTFLNDGPMAVRALAAMRDLLDASGKRQAFLATVEDAARRVKAPDQMADMFRTQSNHYKIHAMLAEELDLLGRTAEARVVRERVGIGGQ